MLNCNEKIDLNKDVTPHYLAFPYCVDGYLLDSVHWFATGGFLPSPNGDLAGERLPRTLGWNCLDSGPYQGHPNPFPVYYPAHPNWRPNNPCLLYTSDAADERSSVDLGGRRIIKKKKTEQVKNMSARYKNK